MMTDSNSVAAFSLISVGDASMIWRLRAYAHTHVATCLSSDDAPGLDANSILTWAIQKVKIFEAIPLAAKHGNDCLDVRDRRAGVKRGCVDCRCLARFQLQNAKSQLQSQDVFVLTDATPGTNAPRSHR